MIKTELFPVIKTALEEDIKDGDITTLATIPDEVFAEGKFLIKENGILAGIEIAELVFNTVDEKIDFKKLMDDGSRISEGDIAAIVSGKASSLLTAERTALNFLQRMSGIATSTKSYVDKISHTRAKILDTRKTVPGLRMLDKFAVKIGGGKNHRIGLFDMFLIKDNHIAVAGSITKAVQSCVDYKSIKNLNYKIEVEVKNLAEIEEAITTEADIIMLDNFSPSEMKMAVDIIGDRFETEASGGINLETIKDYAETGINYISVGALTHSVKALDISLEIEIVNV